MNRNHLLGFAVVIAVLALAAFALWQLFEIHPNSRRVYPSEEAMTNEYLAFDRWLKSNGIPVRIAEHGDYRLIRRAQERQIFIQATLFEWSEEAVDYLIGWVDGGGHLYLSIDEIMNRECLSLIEAFGISVSDDSVQAFNPWSNEEYPNFDRRVSFELYPPEKEGMLFRDWYDQIRLVQARHGNGKITVSGLPYYINFRNMSRETNARMAWGIFAPNGGGIRENEGWLFIRGNTWYQNQSLFGSLFRHGNLTTFLVSILVLLIVGFWAVIPVFGLVKGERETPGKTIGERFLAEGRFLKNHKALDSYRDLYVREIRRELAGRGSASDAAKIEEQLEPLLKKDVRPGEFSIVIGYLKNILERI